ncbi:MAG: RsmG family class I SAM-dependent methyltransferase [Actinomycetota bacterium]
MFDDEAVLAALRSAQRLGFVGARPVEQVIDHARRLVAAVSEVSGSVADIGAGGGVPGFVLIRDRPDLDVTLIDRRSKRTDFLELVVRRHDLGERVEVLSRDVESVIEEVVRGERAAFDAVVARGFGPPDVTLSVMSRLARPGAVLALTDPPAGDRWTSELLAGLPVSREPSPVGVARFRRLS